ncbi:STAS domain-containing protein [Kitasatospora sp. DSM 101779]|uniref:STAS domain-containing protein n=1 Tax=Kitasatospora sp. DSM 101779 TaxID=2853165 RepID=UPI0021DA3363|nr:STAS domain-containing protein [Kitasatospora sp. DSM 101779]MCU7826818.1 STAS domain-containing protein [Kitasatospora sp. DSM 101779]
MHPVIRVTHRSPTPGLRVVQLAGEADPGSTETLRAALDKALSRLPAPHTVVVDCSGLEFCTTAGLNELLTARERAAADGIAFRLSEPQEQLEQLLRVTGTHPLFDIEPAGLLESMT